MQNSPTIKHLLNGKAVVPVRKSLVPPRASASKPPRVSAAARHAPRLSSALAAPRLSTASRLSDAPTDATLVLANDSTTGSNNTIQDDGADFLAGQILNQALNDLFRN